MAPAPPSPRAGASLCGPFCAHVQRAVVWMSVRSQTRLLTLMATEIRYGSDPQAQRVSKLTFARSRRTITGMSAMAEKTPCRTFGAATATATAAEQPINPYGLLRLDANRGREGAHGGRPILTGHRRPDFSAHKHPIESPRRGQSHSWTSPRAYLGVEPRFSWLHLSRRCPAGVRPYVRGGPSSMPLPRSNH